MSDLRESFPTLQDVSTQAGVAAGARTEGQAASGVQGSIGFSFKDSSGNVVLPQLNSQGEILVSSEKSGNDLYARGENAGSSSVVTIATITLTADKVYEGLELAFSCFRDSLCQVIWNDDGTETVLLDGLVGPGLFSFHARMESVEFTAGSTGTQQLLLKANNINALSTMRGTIAIKELA